MALRLADFEASPRRDGDHAAALAAEQRRLARAQVALVAHRRRAILVFEGWDASGKGGAIRRLTAPLDARALRAWAIAPPSAEERARHYLARFWARLPAAGEIAVFDRSWYGRVLDERVRGLVTRAEWTRGYDEINEFEAQQKDAGTVIVKLFLHVSAEEQARRLARRAAHPWKRWTSAAGEPPDPAWRAAYHAAADDMLARTDTRWAPWRVIAADREKYARIAALAHVADALERAVPMVPPEAGGAVGAID